MSLNNDQEVNEKEKVSSEELQVNKDNREYFEDLMKKSSTQLDGYYDRNNPFIRLLLLVLLAVIIFGVVYYFRSYFG